MALIIHWNAIRDWITTNRKSENNGLAALIIHNSRLYKSGSNEGLRHLGAFLYRKVPNIMDDVWEAFFGDDIPGKMDRWGSRWRSRRQRRFLGRWLPVWGAGRWWGWGRVETCLRRRCRPRFAAIVSRGNVDWFRSRYWEQIDGAEQAKHLDITAASR